MFALAVEKPAAERPAFLQAVCGTDIALRARLDALLAAHDQPDTLLATQPAAACPTIKLDLEDAPDEAVGQTLGRYKLLERVGEGGCGVVYVAEQTEPVRRRVALKVIKLGMDTKQVVARFEAERQALAMMDHPNIAKVLDAGTTEVGRPYFVMELVRGIRITDYCDQAQCSTKERLNLFIKVCQAIQHAHQKGIIHRDIKPSNILVTLHDGVPVPKVIDFGIAKATEGRLTDNTVYTQLHQFIGTPAYMSPEQAEMSGLDIDTRSDIYSLGVLLYELLAGSTPFDAKELMASGIDAMRKTIREKEPQRPSTRLSQTLVAAEVTRRTSSGGEESASLRRLLRVKETIHQLKGDLDWIVMKCLEKDRQRRYETANGLAADLKRHLNNEPVVARPPSTAYRFQKAFRRNKLVFAAAGAVAGALLLGVVVSARQVVRATQASKAESRQRLVAEGAQAVAQTKQREAEAERSRAETERQRADAQARKAIDSQQHAKQLLYASDMSLAQQSLKLNNLGRSRLLLDRHRPQPGEEDLRGWEWRYLWQQTRGSALVTLTNRPSRGFDVSFSPDGTRLAVAWFDGQVEVWDVPTRRLLRSLPKDKEAAFGHVAFSPVRNLLAATSGTNAVTLLDLDSGRESTVWRSPDDNGMNVTDLSFSRDGSRVLVYAISSVALRGRDAVWVIDAASGKVESRHEALASFSRFHGAAGLSPDNRRLYLAASDSVKYRYTIRCLDLQSGEELWQTESQRDYGLTKLAVSPDGTVLASASGFEDPTIRIWDARTGRLLFRIEGHTGWVCKLAFTEDGTRLLSAASDQTIRVWDVKNWSEMRVLRGHSDEVHAVAISAKAGLIASAGKDGNVMLWSDDERPGDAGHLVLPESLQNTPVLPVGQSRLLLGTSAGTGRLLDFKAGSSPVDLPGFGPPARPLGFFGTNTLCRWDGTNQIVIGQLRGMDFVEQRRFELKPGEAPRAFALNLEQEVIGWTDAASETAIYVANLKTPGRRTELQSDLTGPKELFFSEKGDFLAAMSPSGLRVWQLDTGRVVVSMNDPVDDAVFAAGGRVLVAAVPLKLDHEIRFHDLSNPDGAPKTFPGADYSRSLAVSPDGRLVAAATDMGHWLLFDALKRELIASTRGHLNAAFKVAFSPDGQRLITSSGGREAVKVWDVSTRQELLTLPGVGSFLVLAAWSPDGEVITAGVPSQVWHAPTWEEIAAAETKDKAESKQP